MYLPRCDGEPYLLDPIVVYAVCVVFAAALTRSTLGFGEALVAAPLLAIRIPLTFAAPLAVLISVVVALAILAQDRRHVEIRSALGLILSSLPGIPIGILLLARGNEHVVNSIVGVLVVGFSVYSLTANAIRRLLGDHYGWLIGGGSPVC